MEERPIRTLLVEDDVDDALLLRKTLESVPSASFELVVADRLSRAVDYATSGEFDVALVDLSLPDSTGLDTFRGLRAAAPELAMVVLTGLDDEQVAVSAVQEGAQDYLVKGQVEPLLLVRSLRYALERQRATRYSALLTERQRLDTAVSQMSDGIVVTDENWRIVMANRAACLLLNLPGESWRGAALPEALQAFELSASLEELQASRARTTDFEISRPSTHPPLYLDARLSRLFDAAGQLTSTVLMLRDVTDAHLARYVQANFFTLVPHKLRTHLAVLSGYLELTKELPETQVAREWKRITEVSRAELRELTRIVRDLLDFKALSSMETLSGEALVCELEPVLAQVTDLIGDRYPDKQLEVRAEVPESLPAAAVAPEHLALVLEKLIDNAAKFGDKVPSEIVIAASEEGNWLRVSVSDNGAGIPHESFDRIFEGFFQVEEHVTGQMSGLGVGLSMARQVVHAYDGTISVQSRIGEGSTFSFTLPAAPAEERTG